MSAKLAPWPPIASTMRRPRAVRNSASLLADFQQLLVSMGVQLHWPEEIQTEVR
jgi:hypothetical protein